MCEESILNLFIIEGLMRSDHESSVAAYIQLVAVKIILDLQAGNTLARIMYRNFFVAAPFWRF